MMSEETGHAPGGQQLMPTQIATQTGQDKEKPAITQALKRAGIDIVNFSQRMIFYLCVLYITLIVIEVSSLIPWGIGSVLSIILYFGLWFMLTMLALGVHVSKLEKKPAEEEKGSKSDDLSTNITMTLVACVGILVAFSQVSRHLSLLIGGFNTGGETSYWLWIRFGFNQLFSHVLFGVSSIFDWKISGIQPTTVWTRALVLIFNVELDVLVIVVVIEQLRTAPRHFLAAKTIPQKNYAEFVFSHLGRVLLFLLWFFPLVIGVDAVVRDRLMLTSAWGWLFLILVGATFAWYSLRGLGLKGRGNKFCALLGIVAGVALVWIAYHHLTVV